MTPEQQNEVWSMLDREHLAQVAHRGPEPVFATISSHAGLLDRLEARLQEAHDASHLPDEATSAGALESFVVRLRLDAARARGA
jgi:hypothetical protein